MISLLDVNVLIALVDDLHPHHPAAVRFFRNAQSTGWATCPLTENGFVRIVGRPDFPRGPGTAELARKALSLYLAAPGHQFWPDDVSLVDLSRFHTLSGTKDLTDIYLLGLAVKHGGRLATFDQRIDPSLVPGGKSAYFILPNS